MYPPVSTPLLPVDWHEQLLDGNGRLATFGGDPWPYGVEANRPTLEALVRYMVEQSLIVTNVNESFPLIAAALNEYLRLEIEATLAAPEAGRC